MSTPRFNHAYTVAFEVRTDHRPRDVTADELLDALAARLADLRRNPSEMIEAAGMPFDSFAYEDEEDVTDRWVAGGMVGPCPHCGQDSGFHDDDGTCA